MGEIAALPLFFSIVSQVALPHSKLNFSLTLEQSDQCFQAMVISQGTKRPNPPPRLPLPEAIAPSEESSISHAG